MPSQEYFDEQRLFDCLAAINKKILAAGGPFVVPKNWRRGERLPGEK
jgi:hypothetical protein